MNRPGQKDTGDAPMPEYKMTAFQEQTTVEGVILVCSIMQGVCTISTQKRKHP